VLADLSGTVVARDDTDGLSLDMGDWRLNLRSSNTEPLLRLNVESRGGAARLAQLVTHLCCVIEGV
jgi:phosphomannomutase